MYEIIYSNSEGVEVVFSLRPPFLIKKKTGFGAVENVIASEQQYGLDGEILVSERLAARDMTIVGTVLGDGTRDLEVLKKLLIAGLNPKIAGTLTYRAFDREYSIDVLIIKAPEMDNPSNNLTKDFTCSFIALDPYWRDMSYYSSLIPLAQATKMHHFPLNITPKYTFATLKSGEIIPVENSGDVEVGGTFYFTLSAEATNPEVYNVITQEYFRFVGSFDVGTRFKLITTRGKKEAVMTAPNGEEMNAMPLRDPGSTFLQFAKGTNYFQVRAASNVGNVIIQLDFQPLVGGV